MSEPVRTASPVPLPKVEAVMNEFSKYYKRWRQLPDGTYVAMVQLLQSVGIYTGVTESGASKRFIFNDPTLALAQYEALTDQACEPVGWTARR